MITSERVRRAGRARSLFTNLRTVLSGVAVVKAALLLWAIEAIIAEMQFAAGDPEGAEGAFVVSVAAAGLALYHYVTGDPRMSKGRARFKLAELRQRQAEQAGDVVEIETDDGTVFEVPAPGFWPDQAKEHFSNNNDVAGVKALLGPVKYLDFRQRGGRADDVALALREFAREQGLSVGESSASQTS